MKQIKKFDLILVGLLLFFMVPMTMISLQYIPYNTDVGFLRIKQQYIHIDVWRKAFFIHVYSSLFVLLAGFTQFSRFILTRHKSLHQLMGKLYVGNILIITGPSSFIMGLYANGGISSQIAFLTLSVLWIFFTFQALLLAIQKKITAHRQFMIRSFALTLSAISLRVWKYAITNIWDDLPPMDVYRAVAWLGWVPNLLIAEWYIRKNKKGI